MKYCMSLLLFFCFNGALYCQLHDADSAFFKNFGIIKVVMPQEKNAVVSRLRSIIVKDKRSDTLRFGVFRGNNEHYIQVMLSDSLSLQKIFQSNLTSDSGTEDIIINISHLSIRNNPFDGKEEEIFPKKKAMICYKARIYLRDNDNYLPLVKIDSTFLTDRSIVNVSKELMSYIIYVTSYKLKEAFTDGRYKNRKSLTAQQVDSLTNFQQIALHSPAKDSGYYQSYNDFLADRVTPAKFMLEKVTKAGFAVYEFQKDGSQALVRNVWGIRSSCGRYIMQDGLAFELYQSNNAYYWTGIYRFEESSIIVPLFYVGGGYTAWALETAAIRIKVPHAPYLLNYETGTKYEFVLKH